MAVTDYNRVGKEASFNPSEFLPIGKRRLTIQGLGIDSSAGSVQKYSLVGELLAKLSGKTGQYSMSGLSTDKYSDGGQSLSGIVSANILASSLSLYSANASIVLAKDGYVKGDMSLALLPLFSKPGITAMNVTPSEGDSAIGSGTHPWPDVFATRINSVAFGSEALATTKQSVLGALNQLNRDLYSVFHAMMPNWANETTEPLATGYTATSDGWLRVQYYNRADQNVWLKIDDKPVAGYVVSRKADYSDYYFYAVVPIAKGQVVTINGACTAYFVPMIGFSAEATT